MTLLFRIVALGAPERGPVTDCPPLYLADLPAAPRPPGPPALVLELVCQQGS